MRSELPSADPDSQEAIQMRLMLQEAIWMRDMCNLQFKLTGTYAPSHEVAQFISRQWMERILEMHGEKGLL